MTIAVGCSAGLLHCPACVEDVVPRLDTGPRYNVAARVSVWFPVWERGPGTMFFVFMEGTPLFVLRWCVLGWFSVALFKILIAKRGGPTENWFCIDLVAIYEFGTYREFSVATENASLARSDTYREFSVATEILARLSETSTENASHTLNS